MCVYMCGVYICVWSLCTHVCMCVRPLGVHVHACVVSVCMCVSTFVCAVVCVRMCGGGLWLDWRLPESFIKRVFAP